MARRNRPAQTVQVVKRSAQVNAMEALLETPEGFWRGSRLLAAEVFWTFAPAIRALIPHFKEGGVADQIGLSTMGVDKYYRCYINNAFTEYLVRLARAVSQDHPCPTCHSVEHHDLAYVAGVICHEAQHPSRDHGDRAEAIAARFPRIWNTAADLEINDDLLQSFLAARKHNPQFPQLCLPHFPKLSLLDNGSKVLGQEQVWTHMEVLHLFKVNGALGLVRDTKLGEVPPTFQHLAQLQFDGYHLLVDGVSHNPGSVLTFGSINLLFEHGTVMFPKVYRAPEYAQFGVDFPDDQIGEVYYYKLLDLIDKMKEEEQKQNCPMCGEPFGSSSKGKGDQEEQGGDSSDTGEEGEDQGDNGDGSKEEKEDGSSEDSKNHNHGDHGSQCDCPHPGHKGSQASQTADWNNSGQDCGSAATGEQAEYELGSPSPSAPGISEAEGKAIKREIAKEIKKAQATQGTVPAGMLRWADAILMPPKVDWRQELRRVVRKALVRSYGHDQRSWSRLGRSSASTGYKYLYPSTYTPVPRVAIVLDSSGSMGAGEGSPLHEAYCEVEGVCKAVKAELFFVSVDAAAGEIQKITSFKQASITGGGGTDMSVGIKAIEDSREVVDVCIVLTDGYTPWPAQAPKSMTVIAALIGRSKDPNATDGIPTWMKTVIVGDNEDEGK